MRRRAAAIIAAGLIYAACSAAVAVVATVVATVVAGMLSVSLPAAVALPLVYLLPAWPAVAVYRQARHGDRRR